MKSLWAAILVLLLAGLGGFLYFSDAGIGVPDVIDERGPSIGVDDRGNPILDLQREEAVTPTLNGEPKPDPKTQPRIRYRLVDASTGEPIAGGRIYRSRDGEVLGTTDREGFTTVVGGLINTAVFGADGYQLEHFFDRLERARDLAKSLARQGFVQVMLQPDDLTARFRLKFLRADGSIAVDVQFRIACLDNPKPDGRDVPSVRMGVGAEIPPEMRATWARHMLLSTIRRPDFNPDLLHFGAQSEGESFRCDGEAGMRFVALGVYRIEAKSGDQFRRRSFDVTPGGEITIQLRQGGFLAGQVIDRRDRHPVVGAGVVVRRDDAIVTSDLTDIEGRFRLGPIAPGGGRLHIEHAGFEPLVVRRVRPGGPAAVHELVPLANHRVRGRVRSLAGRKPLVGAEVRLVSGDGAVVKTRTDETGSFDLRSFLIEPTVEIEMKGFLEYVEMLNANGTDRTFDLIPATPPARMQAGLTSLVVGRVLDSKGLAAPNRPVQARPVNPVANNRFGNRRILRGGRLVSSQMVMTNQNGEFEVEWVKSEAIRLVAPKGPADPKNGHTLDVIIGQRHEVVLRDAR
jgi:hypothetical protein